MAVDYKNSTILSVLIVASVTFVSYEGFQLVINAVNEMTDPDKNIPRAIYLAIFLAIVIYLVIAVGALFSITPQEIVKNKEYALAIGAKNAIGNLGSNLVVLGAVLATSSAISGTVFGSSRRITSYNVCYTKLLRVSVHTFSFGGNITRNNLNFCHARPSSTLPPLPPPVKRGRKGKRS